MIANQSNPEAFSKSSDFRADERLHFVFEDIERRVRIDFGHASREFWEQSFEIIFVNPRVLEKTEDRVGVLDVETAEFSPRSPG